MRAREHPAPRLVEPTPLVALWWKWTATAGATAGASGSGSFIRTSSTTGLWVDPEATNDDTYVDPDDIRSWVTDSLAGTLAVPNLTFDTTPPVISGAASRRVTSTWLMRWGAAALLMVPRRGRFATCRPG